MKLSRAAIAAAFGCLVAAAPWARATETTYSLTRATPVVRPAGAPPNVFAGVFHPQAVERAAWEDRLLKIWRGGFNAVVVAVPWSFGEGAAVNPADLDALFAHASKLGLKLAVSLPTGANADANAWVAALRPVVEKHAGAFLWLQSSAESAAAAEAVRASGWNVAVAPVEQTTVKSAAEEERPYRQAAVAVALREAVGAGSSVLAWDSPFAGVAPPLATEVREGAPARAGSAESGVLPNSFYEGNLFGQVVRALGAPLAAAKPVPGAGADTAGVHVSQRNAGEQGFLLVQTPAEVVSRFRVHFTDPVSQEKVTIPTQPGVALRSFGSGARLLPVNLPVPGAVVRYSTAELFGVYQVKGRTVLLVTDEQGAPNELALGLESTEEPKVLGAPVEPVWDAASRTLRLNFLPMFDDTFITVGDMLTVVVVPYERAQRTWAVARKDALIPLITSAYLVGDVKESEGGFAIDLWGQQGKAAIISLLETKPKYLAVNQRGPRIAWTELVGSLFFFLETPTLVDPERKAPPVQVLKQAHFQTGAQTGADFTRPEFDPAAWEPVKLDKRRGAGSYRVGFKLPEIPGWSVPWQATVQVKGKATLFLNGQAVANVTGAGDQGEYVEVSLPSSLLRAAGEENALGIVVEGELGKVGITPWMAHAVCRHELIFME